MKKQDWSPRQGGPPLKEILEASSRADWWEALRDCHESLGPDRFVEWLTKRCHRRDFREGVLRQIKRKIALPSSRKMETPGDIARQVARFMKTMDKRT